MGFIDLFRPKWRHSDADIRAEAVRNLGVDQHDTIVKVAQHDKDVRVRRIAIKRLDDPHVLTAIAKADPDDAIRELAGEKAASLILHAALADSPDADKALAALTSDKDLVEVARRAARDDVRRRAVERIAEPRALVDVVHRADAHDIKAAALARISDPAALAEIALHEESKSLALSALERVSNPKNLAEIAQKARAKAARAAARARLPAAATPTSSERPPTQKPAAASLRPVDKTRRAKLLQLALAAEAVAQRSDWDAAAREMGEIRARFAEVEEGVRDESLEHRFDEAVKRFVTRREHDEQARARAAAEAAAKKARTEARKATERAAVPPPPPPPPAPLAAPAPIQPPKPSLADRLGALALEAEKMATGKPSAARLADLERRYQAAGADADADAAPTEDDVTALRDRFAAARTGMEARIAEDTARRDAAEAEARAKLDKLAVELERRAEKTDVKGGEAALRSVAGALKAPGDETLKTRIRVAAERVTLKLGEMRDAESWKRWANVPKLEAICKEAEALAEVLNEVEDKRRAPALLKDMQARWKDIGAAPKAQHDALWTRFRAACDAVYEKSKDYFGKLDEERTSNLAKKEELCVKVEALQDSLEWKDTSEAIKKLQEEWKAIGPVPQDKADAIWKRFRAACDRFFGRRSEIDKTRDEERAANLARKEAIAGRVEALQASTDWRQTADEIKAAQEEWQTIGPAPRDKGDAIWKRFRAACDAFFDARKAAFAQADTERQDNLGKKLLLCEKVEALAAAEDNEAALATVKEIQAEWKSIGPVPRDQSDEVWRRFRTACDVIYQRPEAADIAEANANANANANGATGISGFANRLPLGDIAAKLSKKER